VTIFIFTNGWGVFSLGGTDKIYANHPKKTSISPEEWQDILKEAEARCLADNRAYAEASIAEEDKLTEEERPNRRKSPRTLVNERLESAGVKRGNMGIRVREVLAERGFRILSPEQHFEYTSSNDTRMLDPIVGLEESRATAL